MNIVINKIFRSDSGLYLHIKSIHGSKDLKCPLCDYITSRKDVLKIHIEAVHEGLKNFDCKFCGKLFSQNSNLKKHLKRVHKYM